VIFKRIVLGFSSDSLDNVLLATDSGEDSSSVSFGGSLFNGDWAPSSGKAVLPPPKKSFIIPMLRNNEMVHDVQKAGRRSHTCYGIILDLTICDCFLYGDKARFGEPDSGLYDRIRCSTFSQISQSLANTANFYF
jgi:hypothetical protein